MKPYYEQDGITIYHGDCRDVLPHLPKVDLVLTDPPYGIGVQTDSKRFTRKRSPWWQEVDNGRVSTYSPVRGDDEPFDPTHLLQSGVSDRFILWGANNYAQHLPPSNGWLVWYKRRGAESMAENGWPLGECELAWTNVTGAVRYHADLWVGLLRSSEKGEHYHPTQKSVALMSWCIGLVRDCESVLDAYAGSGTALVAAKRLAKKAIGIELEERYCEIAAKRLAQRELFNQPSEAAVQAGGA